MSELFAVDQIEPNPWQPRTSEDPEHIEKIACSIAADDLMQPPVLRLMEGGRAQLAFGHTRHKAFLWLRENFATLGLPDRYDGYTVMPVEVRELTDESMYRQAVSENISRKDLNPIEEAAAMKRAQDDFGYTSVQVGQLFGKSDATVRGMVRLLELPEEAQGLLNRGEISQGAARAILSMQRIASPATVVETVHKISTSLGHALPDDVIAGAVNYLPHTVQMWDDRREGKPRADFGKLWLLDMKNFPNKLLPELSADESDQLKDNPELAAHLVNPPACTACPFYSKIRGTHFCGVKLCYNRKEIAWGREALRAASQDLGIAVYEESDGAYQVLDSNYQSSFEEHHKLFEERHTDLRLIVRSQVRSYHYQSNSYKGVQEDFFLVVVVGEMLEALKAAAKEQRAVDKAEEKQANGRAVLLSKKRDNLVTEAVVYFADLFRDMNFVALNLLNQAPYGWSRLPAGDVPQHQEADDIKATYLRRKFVLNMLREVCYGEKSVVELAGKLANLATASNVNLPNSIMEMAQAADAEIEEQFPGGAQDETEDEIYDEDEEIFEDEFEAEEE